MCSFSTPERVNLDGTVTPATLVYVEQAAMMERNDLTTMYIDFRHLMELSDSVARDDSGDVGAGSSNLADTIANEFYRLEPHLCQAVQTFMQERHPAHALHLNKPKNFYVAFYNFPELSKYVTYS